MSEAIEKSLREAYRSGYADGWVDALQMAADLLGRIAKQRKYADANRWVNARNEDGEERRCDRLMQMRL